MTKDSFLGRGWSFPPTFNLSSKRVEMVEDHEDIRQSLQILVNTNLGERILRSDYGTGINILPFENITVTLLTKLKGILETAILKYESRIELEDILFTDSEPLEGLIHIQIIYIVRATNSRFNFVYPYYIKEGTHLEV